MNLAELHTLTGAYAVHALPDGERRVFERHLAECPPCTQEVRELTATAGRLGVAGAVVPPPEMRDQVLRRTATVRQEAPRVPLPRPEGHGGGRPGRGVRALPRFVPAACLAGIVALGGVTVWQQREAQDARSDARRSEQRAAGLARVLAAPDAKSTSGRLTDGATGTVVVSHSEDRAAFLVSGLPELPELPEGKVYQLWFADGDTMRPAGLLGSSAADKAVLLDGNVGEAAGMGNTVEPAGGSPQPTSGPLALMDFSGA